MQDRNRVDNVEELFFALPEQNTKENGLWNQADPNKNFISSYLICDLGKLYVCYKY